MTETMEQKTARNARVQARYDDLVAAGRHGHYESMFRALREEIEPLRATLGIALVALEYHRDQTRPIELSDEAISALRVALGKTKHPDSCGCRLCDVARNTGAFPFR